jgi:hypothetical protein
MPARGTLPNCTTPLSADPARFSPIVTVQVGYGSASDPPPLRKQRGGAGARSRGSPGPHLNGYLQSCSECLASTPRALAIRLVPAQCCSGFTLLRAAVWRFDAIRLRVSQSAQSGSPFTPGGAPRSGRTPTAPPSATPLVPTVLRRDAMSWMLLRPSFRPEPATPLVPTVLRRDALSWTLLRPSTTGRGNDRRRALVRRFGGPPDDPSRAAPRQRGRRESSCGRPRRLSVFYHTLPTLSSA